MGSEWKSVLRREKLSVLRDIAESKGFNIEETIKPACIVAFSEQMEKNYGDEFKAMDKVIELCKHCDDEEEFLQEVLLLAGIE